MIARSPKKRRFFFSAEEEEEEEKVNPSRAQMASILRVIALILDKSSSIESASDAFCALCTAGEYWIIKVEPFDFARVCVIGECVCCVFKKKTSKFSGREK